MKTTKAYKLDNEIIIVTARIEKTNHHYVSVTADIFEPIEYNELIEEFREALEEGELWRMAVDGENTILGLHDWIEQWSEDDIINYAEAGEYQAFDIDNNDYLLRWAQGGCLHKEITSVTDEFNELIELRLKSDDESLQTASNIISEMQDDDLNTKIPELIGEIFSIDV